MEIPKLIILLSCIYHSYASEHSHTIPVGNYETELQDLGSHVESHDPPVKIIKITKTIAVKIPVPYPVKVVEKVPYPVHISKPYPVPVPQIVHVPKPEHGKTPTPHLHHEALDAPHGYIFNGQQHSKQDGPEYYHQSQEAPASYSGNQHYDVSDDGTSADGPNYNFPSNYHGYDVGDNGSHESQAVNQYQHQFPSNRPSSNSFH